MTCEPRQIAIGTMLWGTTWLDDKISGVLDDDALRGALRAALLDTSHSQPLLIDCAEGYGGGTSERRVAELLSQESPDAPVLLCSKLFPSVWTLTRAQVVRRVRAARDRLGLRGAIPVFFLHTATTLGRGLVFFAHALADAREAGLVQHIGLSNASASQIRLVDSVLRSRGTRLRYNQVMLSLLTWGSESMRACHAECARLGVRTLAFGCIGQGLLCEGLSAQRFASIRAARIAGVSRQDLDAIRSALRRVSQRHPGSNMAQVAIAWVMHKGLHTVVGRQKELARARSEGCSPSVPVARGCARAGRQRAGPLHSAEAALGAAASLSSSSRCSS